MSELVSGYALGEACHNRVALVFLKGDEYNGGVVMEPKKALELSDDLARIAERLRVEDDE